MHCARKHITIIAIVFVSGASSGCALPGLIGMVGSLGSMFKLSGEENELFMTSDESAAANNPYQVRTSNSVLENPDGAKLYGHY